MRKENRIMVAIPDNTMVAMGFHLPFFGERYSPGDLIVENINNAFGVRFVEFGESSRTCEQTGTTIPAKYFRDENNKANIEITDVYVMVRKDGSESPIVGYYRDLVYYGINEFLQSLICL